MNFIARRIISSDEDSMAAIFIGISYPAGMTKEEALAKAREIFPCETGDWELEDESENWIAGNLDCPKSFYEENPDGFEASSDGVTVGFETP